MNWLPSFTKLFLITISGIVLYVSGLVLMIVGGLTTWWSGGGQLIMLLGMAVIGISILLILLKFFMRLDGKA